VPVVSLQLVCDVEYFGALLSSVDVLRPMAIEMHRLSVTGQVCLQMFTMKDRPSQNYLSAIFKSVCVRPGIVVVGMREFLCTHDADLDSNANADDERDDQQDATDGFSSF
jgi:hypothetical protein